MTTIDAGRRSRRATGPTSRGSDAASRHRRSTGHDYYDLDEIRDLLTIVDVLDAAQVSLTLEERARRSTSCPIHGGLKPTSFTWYDNDRRYHCFTGCGAGGDVYALIMALRDVDFATAVRVAARLAGVAPGARPDPAHLAARRAAAAARAAERQRTKTLRSDPRIRTATDEWFALRDAYPRRVATGRAYLRTRGIERLVDQLAAGWREIRYLYFQSRRIAVHADLLLRLHRRV
jgi:DNA primase